VVSLLDDPAVNEPLTDEQRAKMVAWFKVLLWSSPVWGFVVLMVLAGCSGSQTVSMTAPCDLDYDIILNASDGRIYQCDLKAHKWATVHFQKKKPLPIDIVPIYPSDANLILRYQHINPVKTKLLAGIPVGSTFTIKNRGTENITVEAPDGGTVASQSFGKSDNFVIQPNSMSQVIYTSDKDRFYIVRAFGEMGSMDDLYCDHGVNGNLSCVQVVDK
jgi:hypothetical protein